MRCLDRNLFSMCPGGSRPCARRWVFTVAVSLLFAWFRPLADAGDRVFRAGAARVDVSPVHSPVIVNAMFTERSATQTVDRLYARALVLDDGTTRVALTVVDTCMMPRDLIDRAKALAHEQTGIPTERMLV